MEEYIMGTWWEFKRYDENTPFGVWKVSDGVYRNKESYWKSL